MQDGWIKPRALREDKIARLLAAALDPGEAEAIALAWCPRNNWTIILQPSEADLLVCLPVGRRCGPKRCFDPLGTGRAGFQLGCGRFANVGPHRKADREVRPTAAEIPIQLFLGHCNSVGTVRGSDFNMAQMPNAEAMVLHHSVKTVFCAWRDRHQESGRKNSSGAATTRMAGPPGEARNAARKIRAARAV